MSYRNAKPIMPEAVFSGGYVDNTPELFLKDKYSPYLRNARLDGQAIVIRPGHSLFATLTSGSYPKGIGSYLRADPANDVLLVRHNKSGTQKLATITETGTVVDITTAALIASDNRMSFTNIADVIYCMNGSDLFGKLSGTTYSNPSTGIASFAPAFSVVFGGSHWASGWSTNSNKVYKSVADNYEDFSSAGSDSFTFSEQIVGLSANLQSLFYFTKNTISVTTTGDITDTAGTITYNTRALNVKEGALNNACIVEAGNATYFLSSSNVISRIANSSTNEGFDVMDLSGREYRGISKLMESLNKDQTDAFGAYLPEQGLIKWYVRSNGSSINDICIVYDINSDAFLIDTGKPFYDSIFFKGYMYSASMIEGKIFQDEVNQDDEDSGIEFEYWTKEFYLSSPTYKKILWESRTLLDINELASVTQEIYIDGGLVDTKTIGNSEYLTAAGGIAVSPIGMHPIGMSSSNSVDDDYQEVYILRTKGNLNVKGKKIQFRFTNSSVAGKIRLKNIEMLIETLPGISSNLT